MPTVTADDPLVIVVNDQFGELMVVGAEHDTLTRSQPAKSISLDGFRHSHHSSCMIAEPQDRIAVGLCHGNTVSADTDGRSPPS